MIMKTTTSISMGRIIITLLLLIAPALKKNQVDDLMDAVHPALASDIYSVHSTEVSKVPQKFELLCPLFGWALADTIKHAFDVTTQYARGRV
jgi:hypothetical protein